MTDDDVDRIMGGVLEALGTARFLMELDLNPAATRAANRLLVGLEALRGNARALYIDYTDDDDGPHYLGAARAADKETR